MAVWRMSFRAGNQGHEMWPKCLDLKVAAITYGPLERLDLSRYTRGEPANLWARLEPTQKASLGRVAYEMRAGDTIYVKQGPKIISKGRVTGPYRFDSKFRIIDPNDSPWAHQVPVEWDLKFPVTEVLLGGEQVTVLKLSREQGKLLSARVEQATRAAKVMEADEGTEFKNEAIFRSRNRALIRAKKANCDYCCEICHFNFEETYGEIGHKFIVAHHLKLVSAGPSKTKLDDIALVCANCHSMIHLTKQPMSIEELRTHLERRRRQKL